MPQTFTLISLGDRGVGKTVFLASNCAEILRSGQRKSNAQNLWFECIDPEHQDNVEKLVDYVVRKGQYPPPTFKISDFNFCLKGKGIRGDKTLCNFQWLDIPGEWCDLKNPEFQSVLLQSHGCCVFIDAYNLLHDRDYSKIIAKTMNQLEAIASLVNQYNLNYPIALICTKCDLIDSGPIGLLQLEEKLRPLTQRLDSVKAHYRRFYSAIPIVNQADGGILKVKDATAPLLWLIAELRKLHGSEAQVNLGSALDQILPNSANPRRVKIANPWLTTLSSAQKFILAALVGCSILAALVAIGFTLGSGSQKSTSSPPPSSTPAQKLQQYEPVLDRDPTNHEAMAQVIDAYIELGQYDKAVARVEKTLQAAPKDVNILLELASLYSLNSQDDKAESTYDQILNVDKGNLFALMGKATIRSKKGDMKEAKRLFEEAKKYAPQESTKAEIDKILKEQLKP